MSLIDLFTRFHRIAIQQEYPPFARVLFDILLYKFNSKFWVDELAFTQMDLSEWTGLNKKSLDEAKHFLTSRHIIEITKRKREMVFRFGTDWQIKKSNGEAKKSNAENRVGTPNIAKEFSDNSKKRNFDLTENRICSEFGTQLEPQEPISYIRARKDKEDFKDLNDERQMMNAPAREDDLDKAERLWQELGGGRLSIEHLSKLEIYLKAHGLNRVEDAMREASDSNNNPYGVSPKFLFTVLENKFQAGKKSERRDSMREVEAEYYAAAETKNDLIDYKKYLKGV